MLRDRSVSCNLCSYLYVTCLLVLHCIIFIKVQRYVKLENITNDHDGFINEKAQFVSAMLPIQCLEGHHLLKCFKCDALWCSSLRIVEYFKSSCKCKGKYSLKCLFLIQLRRRLVHTIYHCYIWCLHVLLCCVRKGTRIQRLLLDVKTAQ